MASLAYYLLQPYLPIFNHIIQAVLPLEKGLRIFIYTTTNSAPNKYYKIYNKLFTNINIEFARVYIYRIKSPKKPLLELISQLPKGPINFTLGLATKYYIKAFIILTINKDPKITKLFL